MARLTRLALHDVFVLFVTFVVDRSVPSWFASVVHLDGLGGKTPPYHLKPSALIAFRLSVLPS